MPSHTKHSEEALAAGLCKDSSAAGKERLGSFSEEMGKPLCVHPQTRPPRPARKSRGISSSVWWVFSRGKFLAAADSRET